MSDELDIEQLDIQIGATKDGRVFILLTDDETGQKSSLQMDPDFAEQTALEILEMVEAARGQTPKH